MARILIIEDDEPVRSTVKQMLELAGHAVATGFAVGAIFGMGVLALARGGSNSAHRDSSVPYADFLGGQARDAAQNSARTISQRMAAPDSPRLARRTVKWKLPGAGHRRIEAHGRRRKGSGRRPPI